MVILSLCLLPHHSSLWPISSRLTIVVILVSGPQGATGVSLVVQQCYSKMLRHPKRVVTVRSLLVCHLPLCSSIDPSGKAKDDSSDRDKNGKEMNSLAHPC